MVLRIVQRPWLITLLLLFVWLSLAGFKTLDYIDTPACKPDYSSM